MRTRLFHTVVLVGTTMGSSLVTVSCSSSDSGQCQGQSCGTFPGISYVGDTGRDETFPGISIDAGSDTWPGIGYKGDTGRWDSIADTWPGIHPLEDTGSADTSDGGDTWPGISPGDGGAG